MVNVSGGIKMTQRNNAQKKRIQAQSRAGILSHAWLVLGGASGAREELAGYIASALICPSGEPPCGSCSHCVKLAKGIHPDLIRMEKLPDKSEYVVDQVREIVRDAYIMPNEAPRKVYFIPAADEMNEKAQNAMLKILEEPPARSAFILVAENPAAILDTQDIPAMRMPICRAAMASGTVDMPTASAPIVRSARISAGVSKLGPVM